MSSTINRSAYQQLVDEDIEWLKSQKWGLENQHIQQIVNDSPNRYYKAASYDDVSAFVSGWLLNNKHRRTRGMEWNDDRITDVVNMIREFHDVS